MRKSSLYKDLKEGDSGQREQQKTDPCSQNRVCISSAAGEGAQRSQEGRGWSPRGLVKSLDFRTRAVVPNFSIEE